MPEHREHRVRVVLVVLSLSRPILWLQCTESEDHGGALARRTDKASSRSILSIASGSSRPSRGRIAGLRRRHQLESLHEARVDRRGWRACSWIDHFPDGGERGPTRQLAHHGDHDAGCALKARRRPRCAGRASSHTPGEFTLQNSVPGIGCSPGRSRKPGVG